MELSFFLIANVVVFWLILIAVKLDGIRKAIDEQTAYLKSQDDEDDVDAPAGS